MLVKVTTDKPDKPKLENKFETKPEKYHGEDNKKEGSNHNVQFDLDKFESDKTDHFEPEEPEDLDEVPTRPFFSVERPKRPQEVEIQPQVSISSTLYSHLFSYESTLLSFSGITVWLCDILAKGYWRKSCS